MKDAGLMFPDFGVQAQDSEVEHMGASYKGFKFDPAVPKPDPTTL